MTFNSLYVCGDVTLVYEFQDATIAERWFERVREIKDRVAFNELQMGGGTVTEAVHREHASQWLDLVAGVLQEFGSAYLPPDIKEAVNGTELFLGRAQTIW